MKPLDTATVPPPLDRRYQLEHPLGQGSFGAVLLCRDRELDRLVALKRLHVEDEDGSAVERFRREALYTSRIEHAAIVRLYDHGVVEDGSLFIVYEYVPGPSLLEHLREERPPPLATVMHWGASVAGALEQIHRAGMLHRDVKPGNVILRGGEQPVLCDFGLAGSLQGASRLTRTGHILGTPRYLAPECWLQSEASPHSDLWSWAAVLYEVAYRRRVCDFRVLSEHQDWLGAGAVVRVPEGRRGECPAFEAELLRALHPDPARRHPRLADFEAALERSLEEGSEALPPPRRAPVVDPAPGPPAHARPRPWGLLVAMVGMLLLGLALGTLTDPAGRDPDRAGSEAAPAGDLPAGLRTQQERLREHLAHFRTRLADGVEGWQPLPPCLVMHSEAGRVRSFLVGLGFLPRLEDFLEEQVRWFRALARHRREHRGGPPLEHHLAVRDFHDRELLPLTTYLSSLVFAAEIHWLALHTDLMVALGLTGEARDFAELWPQRKKALRTAFGELLRGIEGLEPAPGGARLALETMVRADRIEVPADRRLVEVHERLVEASQEDHPYWLAMALLQTLHSIPLTSAVPCELRDRLRRDLEERLFRRELPVPEAQRVHLLAGLLVEEIRSVRICQQKGKLLSPVALHRLLDELERPGVRKRPAVRLAAAHTLYAAAHRIPVFEPVPGSFLPALDRARELAAPGVVEANIHPDASLADTAPR